ncbi:SDR family NAD(P)-dependent oxidoreductase [Henriciella pelagia]|jgi:NAD(P)-dependent dehydrogenase (short-subunit alcohol dehydrogenase family)|uniref:3-oxoacyl-ACP reductase n=1 Tax=Henriciella pelagia TaxID=1977912 RepID=A0ABQ1J912_9PROT|nr:glucose 1-dehydrogenase [Henriciella pelagia]GGB63020.1 3-oxoacyl-ACP reductase [Henriciella pelagia]
MELFDLSGKTALITGASGGLGASFARELAAAGAHVVLAARRLEKLESLANAIEASGGKALAVAMDVTDPDSVTAAFATVQETLGRPCDIIINNSGISRDDWFTRMTEEDWRAVMNTNLDGVWRVAKAGANALIDAGKPGSIINIASITARRPQHTIAAYAASKAAVEHFTHVMALELARYGIRSNAIAPGYFSTDINDEFLESEQGEKMRKRVPMRRFGEYRELAGALLLLASDAGSYMTGTTIVVDGGHLVSTL